MKLSKIARTRLSFIPLLWAVLVIGGIPALTRAQAPPAPATQAAPPHPPFGNIDLIGALKQVPGCLGVEAARTASGKQVIFAWFENKQALLRWYSSDVHVRAMNMLSPPEPGHVPLAGVPDDNEPILAIASVTSTTTPPATGQPPFAQIAIELYRPLSGGIAVGGKFAPDALKVPGLREIGARAGTK